MSIQIDGYMNDPYRSIITCPIDLEPKVIRSVTSGTNITVSNRSTNNTEIRLETNASPYEVAWILARNFGRDYTSNGQGGYLIPLHVSRVSGAVNQGRFTKGERVAGIIGFRDGIARTGVILVKHGDGISYDVEIDIPLTGSQPAWSKVHRCKDEFGALKTYGIPEAFAPVVGDVIESTHPLDGTNLRGIVTDIKVNERPAFGDAVFREYLCETSVTEGDMQIYEGQIIQNTLNNLNLIRFRLHDAR